MAGKRGRVEIISDFSIKPGDAPAIQVALNFVFPTFQVFVDNLTDVQLNEFKQYAKGQKNADRILEWILGNIAAFRSIQDKTKEVIHRIIFIRTNN